MTTSPNWQQKLLYRLHIWYRLPLLKGNIFSACHLLPEHVLIFDVICGAGEVFGLPRSDLCLDPYRS